jgi:hypothetical protein
MYWLAEAAAQADVLRDMNRMIVLQGTPELALEYIEQRDAILAG